MEFRETPSATGVKEKIRQQFFTFKGYLVKMFGLTDKQANQFQEFSEPALTQDLEERQLSLTQKIKANLEKKGILASDKESSEFYKRQFGLTGFSAPEVFLQFPGGATFFDEETQQVKVYLNPRLHLSKPDYQLFVVLEEAIHWYLLKHNNRTEVTIQDEVSAKNKILRIADFLGFNQERVNFLKSERDLAMADLQKHQP